ncbi:hypothetical protein B0H19DRAFT_1082516 [Mycena capillaripes]|nr:hypothetical protein B0H19DRAFT_1082516 [Mycena capillaripes]
MLLAVQLSLVLSSSAMALCLGPGGPGPTFYFTVPRNCSIGDRLAASVPACCLAANLIRAPYPQIGTVATKRLRTYLFTLTEFKRQEKLVNFVQLVFPSGPFVLSFMFVLLRIYYI